MRADSCLLVAAFAAGAPIAATAQQPAQSAPSGTISGSVIDARTAAPLAHATVTLVPADGNGLLLDARGTSSFELARTVTTTTGGTYRFADLPIGAYRLRIQRLGYEPATIDVRLGDTGTSPLSIGLVVVPVRLRAVEIHAHDSGALTDDFPGATGDDGRLAAVRARQQAFLSTDARELTVADIAESATVGGSDVLRSLQRLPGVSQLDDWSAELWVRGNRWDHNRIYYDGLPLFDPLGVLGRASGVSADAIGGAFLHPGVRPVSLGGEGATQIDLRSRPASGAGSWRGSAELSQFGASAALERERADTSAGFLVTAHHSLGRLLPDGAFTEALAGRSYSDAQATARGDVDFDGGRRIETSGLYSHDARVLGSDFDASPSQDWTNAIGRVTFVAPLGSFATSHTLGVSHFASRSARFISSTSDSAIASPALSSVDYLSVSGRSAPRAPQANVTTAGYDVTIQRASFDGTHESVYFGDPNLARASRRTSIGYGSAWVDNRTSLGTRLTIENGFRVDVGGAHGLEALRPAGSAQGLFALSPNTRVSVGAGRAHQYVQGIALPLVAQGQTMPTSWLTTGDGVPVMSVDNAMAGVEQWVGTGVIVAANVYLRHTTGMIVSDPTPGLVIQRPLFVDATESARGVEVSARKLIGRTTGLIAYSYNHAVTDARGLAFPAPANRTHAFDAATFVHLGGFNVGGAYALTSGAPYTRTMLAAAVTQTAPGTPLVPVRQAPDAQRLPNFSSLDVSADYTRAFGSVALSAFGGAQNLLGRKNSTWYEVTGYCENGQISPPASPVCREHDLLQAPVRLAPTFGLRAVVR